MTNFSKIAATSQAAGFPYYDIQDFGFVIPGQTVPFVSGGTYHHYTQTDSLPRDRLNKANGLQIMTNVIMNIDPIDSPNQFHLARYGRSGFQVIGSSGGFPILYNFNINIFSDTNNLYFETDVGNSSAVNNVNAPTLTLTGKVFFYLAPF